MKNTKLLFLLPFSCLLPAAAMTITTLGSLGDLNGNGSLADEEAVLNAAVHELSTIIQPNRDFTVYVGVGAYSGGRVDTFDELYYPVTGTITVASSMPGYGWWVDPTPGDDSEFVQDIEFPFLYRDGPEGAQLDLYSTLCHELGHALFMQASLSDPTFNPRYRSLISTENGTAYVNLPSGRVPLRTGDYSHFAVVGTLGKGRTLMDSPRLVYDGRPVRTHIDSVVAELANTVYRPMQNDPTEVPEAGTYTLVGVGLAALSFLKRR